jgi:hypothetical protein
VRCSTYGGVRACVVCVCVCVCLCVRVVRVDFRVFFVASFPLVGRLVGWLPFLCVAARSRSTHAHTHTHTHRRTHTHHTHTHTYIHTYTHTHTHAPATGGGRRAQHRLHVARRQPGHAHGVSIVLLFLLCCCCHCCFFELKPTWFAGGWSWCLYVVFLCFFGCFCWCCCLLAGFPSDDASSFLSCLSTQCMVSHAHADTHARTHIHT